MFDPKTLHVPALLYCISTPAVLVAFALLLPPFFFWLTAGGGGGMIIPYMVLARLLCPISIRSLLIFKASTTTVTSTTATTTTTTTTLDVAKLRADGGTAAELLAMGADPIKMVEGNYTAVELAEAGMSAEEIAAASGNLLDVSDLKLVGDEMTAEILKENGFSANDLMLGGFVATDLEDAGFSSSAIRIAQSKYDRANPASSAPSSAGTNQTVIIVAAVLILFAVLGAAMYVRRARAGQQNSGDGAPAAFENPMYGDGTFDGGQHPHGSAGYMDVPAGGGSSGGGYMDVAAGGAGGGSSMQSGYMNGAPTESFDGGFEGGGFESDDEEV